jgi:hypothetical protein
VLQQTAYAEIKSREIFPQELGVKRRKRRLLADYYFIFRQIIEAENATNALRN